MDDSAEDHDAQELDRLVRFMTRAGRRFGLALVTYADAKLADARREQADQRASGRDVRSTTVRMRDLEQDVIGQLGAASTTRDIIHVVELDEIAIDREGRRATTQALRDLNLRRDELPKRVEARVVVWIAAEAYPQMAKLAWDLLDVMLTRFEFRSERSVAVRRTWRPALRFNTAIDDRPIWAQEADAHARIATSASDITRKADVTARAGNLYAEVGKLEEAIEHLERAALLYERIMNDHLYSVVLAVAARRDLAKALWRKREPQRALDEIARALELADSAARNAEASGPDRETLEIERLECLWTQLVFERELVPEVSRFVATTENFELIERWHNGEPDALRKLFSQHLPTVARFLELLTQEEVDETRVVMTFMELWELPPPPPTANLRATIFESARAVARGQSRTPTWVETPGLPPALQISVEQLRPDACELIEMHYQFGVPVGELAEMFGVVEPTLQYRLSAAVNELLARHTERTGEQLTEQALRAALKPGQHQHTMAR